MCAGFPGWSGATVLQVAIKTLRQKQRRATTEGPLTIYILLPDDFLVSATGLLGVGVGVWGSGLTEWHRKVKMLGYKRIRMWGSGGGGGGCGAGAAGGGVGHSWGFTQSLKEQHTLTSGRAPEDPNVLSGASRTSWG